MSQTSHLKTDRINLVCLACCVWSINNGGRFRPTGSECAVATTTAAPHHISVGLSSCGSARGELLETQGTKVLDELRLHASQGLGGEVEERQWESLCSNILKESLQEGRFLLGCAACVFVFPHAFLLLAHLTVSQEYDPEHGGFGIKPKFPRAVYVLQTCDR